MKEEKKIEKTSESKIEISKKRVCNSCKCELPEVLDRGICPFCKRRN